jgi:hypothetical protein
MTLLGSWILEGRGLAMTPHDWHKQEREQK